MEIYKVALQGSGFVNWLNFNQPMTFNEDLVLTQVYETLFNKNEYGKIENSLAANFKLSGQLLTIEIKNREFHNGQKLRAEDIINSLNESFQSPYKHNNNGWSEDFIKFESPDLKVIDELSLSIDIKNFKLKDVLLELCKVKHSIKKGKLGTGPYLVDQVRSADQKVILKQNKTHPEHKNCVDEIHLIGYKNNFETLKAFLNKEVDQVRVWGLQSPFKYNPHTLMVPSKTFYSSYFQFNTKSSNFNNKSLRQKFKNAFLTNIMLHKEYPWNAFTGVVPSTNFNSPKLTTKSQQCVVVRLGVAHKRQKKEVERIIDKTHFKNLGYKIKIINFESYEKLYNSDADLIYTAFSYEQNNKHKLPEIFHSSHRKNKTGYQNQNLDTLIENKKYKQAEEMIWNQSLLIPLGWFQCHILTHKDSSLFCGIKNNKVTPVLYKSKLQDFIELFSVSQNELFKLREKNWSQLSQKAKVQEVLSQFQHDIKSPLSVLRLMSQKIDNSNQVYERVLQRVELFNNNIAKEIQQAVEPKQNLDKRVLVNQLIHEIVEEKKLNLNQAICIDVSQTEHSPLVCACPNTLKRVLSNLLDNAIESRNKWKHKVKIETKVENSQVFISIKDNGKGFTTQQLELVQCLNKQSTKNKGQGLGLYNAKKYIESLGGEFSIVSKTHLYTEVQLKLQLDCVMAGNQSVNRVQKLGT